MGLKRGNAFGLHELHGNVYEWCQDFWDEKWYQNIAPDNSNSPVAGSNRVIRGGHWNGSASNCRSAYRHNNSPSTRSYSLGFRVMRLW